MYHKFKGCVTGKFLSLQLLTRIGERMIDAELQRSALVGVLGQFCGFATSAMPGAASAFIGSKI